MATWDIEAGETLVRTELHDRWGGGRYGGMEPAVKAHSVFLFTKPRVGEVFGYKYDGWHADGTFHYTGDGQVGDQTLRSGGNKALLDAPALGRAIRLFRSEGTSTTYIGEFQLPDPPYYRADALDRNREMRSVVVYRLRPLGPVLHSDADTVNDDLPTPEELPLEVVDVEQYALERPDEPPVAVRREALLVQRYAAWLASLDEESVRHRIPIPGGGYVFTDVFNKATSELIEAKASAGRIYIRAGLGQILDLSRFLDHKARALLVPVRPSEDLIELLRSHGVAVIWENGPTFERSAAQ